MSGRKPLVNELAWSNSRVRQLFNCLRAYYWSYYGSWNGWEQWAAPTARAAYRLKKLQSRWAWAGDVAHNAIRDSMLSIRQGTAPNVERAVSWSRLTMRAELRASQSGPRDRKNPRGFWGLLEHEYQEAIDPDEWRRIWTRAEKSIRWWFASDWIRLAREAPPASWLEVDEAGGKMKSFELEGVKAFSAPDWSFRDDAGVQVVDWKTGKAKPEDRDQVIGAALAMTARYGTPTVGALGHLVYLLQGTWDTFTISAEALESFRGRVRAELASMRGALVDEKTNTPGPLEAFPMTEDLKKCAVCEFRRLCGRDRP